MNNAQLLTYLACQMVHALEAADKRTANEILACALATAQAHALSN